MAAATVHTGGACPKCKTGTLVKHTMTKLECNDCGFESIVAPSDSVTFVKKPDTTGLWLLFLLVVGATLLLVCDEQVSLLLTYTFE